MAFGIVLTLDPSADRLIREIWRDFDQAGIGKTPGSFGEPPHVSFSGDLEAGVDVLRQVTEQTPLDDLHLRLVPFGIFAGRKHTLYFTAILSEGLRAAHRAHYDLLATRRVQFNEMYAPSKVVFHCTIAVEIEEEDLGRAIALISTRMTPIAAEASSVQLWSYFPARLRYERPLTLRESRKRK